jgi:hypothetical protein
LLDLQVFHFCGSSWRGLPRCQRHEQRQYANLFPTLHHTSSLAGISAAVNLSLYIGLAPYQPTYLTIVQNLAASAILVTLVAIHAVVNVSIHALVILVGLRLLMAVGALEHRVVVRVRVAGCADTIRSAVIGREISVIKGRTRPRSRGVTRRTSRGEASRFVIRIRGVVVVHRMAAVAIRRKSRVVVVHVAKGAGHGGMRSGQRERGVVVIKAGARPVGRAVADVASGREADLGVIRGVGVVVVGLMAADAGGIGAGQLVVAIHVALLTRHREVESGERPTSG